MTQPIALNSEQAQRLLTILEKRVYPRMKAAPDGIACTATVGVVFNVLVAANNKNPRQDRVYLAGWPLNCFLTDSPRWKYISKDERLHGMRTSMARLREIVHFGG